ncbi:hypothetical protein BK004_01405 [bacterium CG10_46_32]|nr:MAG: hypothetical protein BK004_01405 [bacterium CG10_46_32]PIR56354.1 MAG: hypothetical protein COU73_01420 [Parcubacteria group bacterium CG10_big_fil_rev_8_21_14_0_10_46_32]
MHEQFKDKVILITGGTGTIGSELVQQLLKCHPKQVRILSREEGKQYELLERLKYPKNLRLLIGDIRDRDRIDYAFKDVDIVLHTAAMKQVPLCEYNPAEAVKTNIVGSQNVIDASLKNQVEKVIAISTDKAVYPTNVMGTSKLMMEKMFINANWTSGKAVTKFACVRFGNVAWARGSVLPLWKKQAENESRINITNPNMTRFMMSIEQAVNLVLKAVELVQVGEIFVLKMSSITIGELGNMFTAKYYPDKKIAISVSGDRVGDKMHEELVDDNDRTSYILEDKDMYIFVPRFLELYGVEQDVPQYAGFTKIDTIGRYSSDEHINSEKIKSIV